MLSNLSRIFLIIGIIFIVLGGLFYMGSRFNLPLGKLPGDFEIQGKGYTCFFPLATFLLLSIVLSVVLTLIARFTGRR